MRRGDRRNLCRLKKGGGRSFRRDIRIEWLWSHPLMPTLPIITAALRTGNANLALCIRWICQKGREWESMGTPRATLGGHPYRHE